MSAQTVANLLREWLAPAVVSETTPAKAANSAKAEDSCGLQADPVNCEGLRISANQPTSPGTAGADSQTFAALRIPAHHPQSEQRRGFSQDSQDSQGFPFRTHVRTCQDCRHRLRRGTCGEPEAAGLIPAGRGYGIIWAEPGHATDCAAFMPIKRTDMDRPYRLSPAEGDAAHAQAWDDAAIALYRVRVGRLHRRGFREPDAEDLAERLHLRDVHADHRTLCLECRHLSGTTATGWRCGNWQAARVVRELAGDLITLLQHCQGFSDLAELKATAQDCRNHPVDQAHPEGHGEFCDSGDLLPATLQPRTKSRKGLSQTTTKDTP